MFKLIAIETIKNSKKLMIESLMSRISMKDKCDQIITCDGKSDRYDSVMKVLGADQDAHIYKFYQNYEIKNNTPQVKSDIPEWKDYFKKDAGIDINLCAIVGANGSGKSTILELIIRLLNNVAYALKEGIRSYNSAPMHFAECVYARLYIEEADGTFCYIEQEDLTLKWVNTKDHNKDWEYYVKDKYPKRNGKEISGDECFYILQETMFYTIVVNYSAYALNTEDFRCEWSKWNEYRDGQHNWNDDANSDYETNDESKEGVQCWIDALFHKNDAYQIPIVLNPYREKGVVDVNKEKSLLNDRLFLMLLDNKDMLKALLGGKDPYYFIFDRNKDFWAMYAPTGVNKFYTIKVLHIFEELGMHITKDDAYAYEIGKTIISCWERCYGYKFVEGGIDNLTLKNNDDQLAALNYIVYKTIKVTIIYKDYKDYSDSIKQHDKEKIKELVMCLYCDMSHITLKLRRTITFLLLGHYGTNMPQDISREHNRIEIEQFKKNMQEHTANLFDLEQNIPSSRKINDAYLDDEFKKKLLTRRGKKWMREELLPAPCLKTVIILKLENGNELPFDSLSSGEKQFIYYLGTMMYQLHNLNSVNGKNKLQYSCVNLIFDEIDLYFHPNYQRQLIKRLIDMINSMGLNVVKHINIMMATHSPFILSDIPKNNIIYLENGEDVSNQVNVNPLGANINDILHRSFFLKDGFIGEYVCDKILNLIDKINNYSENDDDDIILEMEKKIEAIGDPFIKEQLWELYLSKKYDGKTDEIISWMENKLKTLKRKDEAYFN